MGPHYGSAYCLEKGVAVKVGGGGSRQHELVMVDDFGRLMLEQERRREKLQELEKAEAIHGGRAVILCHKDPLHLFSGQEGNPQYLVKVASPPLRSGLPRLKSVASVSTRASVSTQRLMRL
jgi:hypothetical protein